MDYQTFQIIRRYLTHNFLLLLLYLGCTINQMRMLFVYILQLLVL